MGDRTVAYVVKGFPRRSELFITSEIWRLERLGVPIRVVVLTPPDEAEHDAVVDSIAATPWHLPAMTSLSATPAVAWLRTNLRPYAPALCRTARRHPFRLARVSSMAALQAVRARQGWRPRKVYLKELLQAVAVADRVAGWGDVAHLHAHFAHGSTTVTWWAARLSGLPFSFTGHAKDLYLGSLNPAGLLRRKLRAASFALTCTGANASHLRRLAPGTPVHLVYHGLNPELARLLADEPPRRGDGPFRIASVGRSVEKKGFDVLVAAFARLRQQGVDARLVIAGEPGPACATVDQLVRRHGLADVVERRGPLSQIELLGVMRSCDVFALACRVARDGDRDGIPNVLVEAMAAGATVVSTRVSGIPELVTDGHDGVLVPADDPEALAAALARLATDRPARERMAAAARATVVARFDGDVLARHLAGLMAAQL